MSVRCSSWRWSLRAQPRRSWRRNSHSRQVASEQLACEQLATRVRARPDISGRALLRLGCGTSLVCPAAQRQWHQGGLKLDFEAHLALALAPVSEVDRQLDDLEAVLDSAVVHLDLEAVAVAADA